MEVLGVPLNRIERQLRAATFDLSALLVPAHEQGAERLEPSHILLALARIRGGLAESELAERRVSVDRLSEAFKAIPHPAGSAIIEAITTATVSEDTAGLFGALRQHVAEGGIVGERLLLGHTLSHLETPVVELLRRVRIDTGGWAAELLEPPPEAPAVFLETGDLNAEVFSPAALRALSTLCREAGALGHERLTNPLLLQTLAVTPDGLLEQALHFLQYDVRGFRERLFSVVGIRRGPPVDNVRLTKLTADTGLALVLERASSMATGRRSAVIAERDLIGAMLATPGSVAETFFRDLEVNVPRLLKFAQDYYEEPDPETTTSARAAVGATEAAAYMHSRLLGQRDVVELLLPHVRRIKLGLELGYHRDASPSAALLLCGPSGTGKTMTARVLAELIYGSQDDVLMFEMGQFNSRESINNFIGAPPGYIGFGEGKLTNGLRDNPRRVLLFDEVEKADARVFDALLRLLDEGKIGDPAGPVRDARESVIVLTSNIGGRELSGRPTSPTAPGETTGETPGSLRGLMAQTPLAVEQEQAAASADLPSDQLDGPGRATAPADPRLRRAQLRALLERFFRPEFLNRVDEIVMFHGFGRDELRAIAKAALAQERAKATELLGVDLRWGSELPDFLADQALRWRPDEAARGVNRLVTGLVPSMLDRVHAAREAGRPIRTLVVVARGDLLAVDEDRDA